MIGFINLNKNLFLYANIIELILFLITIRINFIINRRVETICWMIFNIIEAIAYWLLGAKTGIGLCIYGAVRFGLTYILHRKEEKIVQSKLECVVLGLPYIIISIIYKEKFSILFGVGCFINTCLYIIKIEKKRFIVDAISQIGFILYDILCGNIIGAIKVIIECGQKMINCYRVVKNGEGKYYGKRIKNGIV